MNRSLARKRLRRRGSTNTDKSVLCSVRCRLQASGSRRVPVGAEQQHLLCRLSRDAQVHRIAKRCRGRRKAIHHSPRAAASDGIGQCCPRAGLATRNSCLSWQLGIVRRFRDNGQKGPPLRTSRSKPPSPRPISTYGLGAHGDDRVRRVSTDLASGCSVGQNNLERTRFGCSLEDVVALFRVVEGHAVRDHLGRIECAR